MCVYAVPILDFWGHYAKLCRRLGRRRVLRNGWNVFVRVSLRLESHSRKALEKQYLFAVRFQLVFFFSLSLSLSLKQETVRHSRYKIFT